MFIDDVMNLVSRKTPHKLTKDASDEEFADFVEQLARLDASTPRFDVHNIHVVLNPSLVKPVQPNPIVEQRNQNLTEKRDDLLALATAAPINHPYDVFWLERRYSDAQRLGYLVTYDATKLLYNVTLVFDSTDNRGEVAAITNCFQILPQTPDDMMFGGFDYRTHGKIMENDEVQKTMKDSAVLVRTFIQLKNWSSDEVPTVTLSGGNGSTSGGTKGNGGVSSAKSPTAKKPKSNPSIIRFEPFLKKSRGCSIPHAQRKSRGMQAETIVAGGWRNYTIQAPLFGNKPVLGKTYGRLWHRPFKRGNPNLGVKAPSGIFVVGNVHNPNLAPTPAPVQSKKKRRGKKWKEAV